MQPSKEQQLIDIMCHIAMTSAQYLHGKSNEEKLQEKKPAA